MSCSSRLPGFTACVMVLAAAAPASAEPSEWSAAVEHGFVANQSSVVYQVAPSYQIVGLSLARRWPRGYEASLGIGVPFGPLMAQGAGFEGHAVVRLAPAIGPWRPAMGLELGFTSATQANVAALAAAGQTLPGLPSGTNATIAPWFAGFSASPLRFQWNRLSVDVGSILIATSLPGAGQVVRLQFSPLQLGWAL